MAPLVVIGGLLWLANRRASRLQQESPDDEATSEAPSEP